jgi:uncharacterized protein (DUF3820 family)
MLEERTLEELIDLQDQPILLKTMKFGKHKGWKWENLPRDYLAWLLKQDSDGGIGTNERYTARYWLEH